MDESIPKFRNESLSKIDVVLHRLCTNPHSEHKAHNDSAQNCQFPWSPVTHMSGAPPERHNLSGSVLPRDGSVKCLVPGQTASLLGTVPSPRRTIGTSKIVRRCAPTEQRCGLLLAPGETVSLLDRVSLVAPPAEQQERTPLERQRRWSAQELSKNITSRQMKSRKLRHRTSGDKMSPP